SVSGTVPSRSFGTLVAKTMRDVPPAPGSIQATVPRLTSTDASRDSVPARVNSTNVAVMLLLQLGAHPAGSSGSPDRRSCGELGDDSVHGMLVRKADAEPGVSTLRQPVWRQRPKGATEVLEQ